MNDSIDSINELEGRIEGISHLLLKLTSGLEMNDCINGIKITESLRRKADKLLGLDPDVLSCSQRALRHLSDELDAARNQRKKQAN